jgi:hypothetical protein
MTNYNNDVGEYYANKYGFLFTEKAWLENKQELFMFAREVAQAVRSEIALEELTKQAQEQGEYK